MDLVNERVEHIKFGVGVITEANNDKIAIKYQDVIGTKLFPYPDAFDRFLKAVNPDVQDYAMEEYRRKQQLMELERERVEKERQAAVLEEIEAKLALAKEKAAARAKKKK